MMDSTRRKITDTEVKRLPVPMSGQALYFDSVLPGFGVRVTQSGRKSYIVNKWSHGKVHRITLGDAAQINSYQARTLAVTRFGELAKGTDPAREKRDGIANAKIQRQVAVARGIPLHQVLMDYFAAKKKLSARTQYDYQRLVLCYLDTWQDRPLVSIDQKALSKIYDDVGKRSPAQANYAARLLRALFYFAKAKYPNIGIVENPVTQFFEIHDWYRVDRRQTLVKSHELKAWWDATESINEDSRDFLRVLLLTGLRKLEGAALERSNIDLKGKTFTAIRKGNSKHTLPMGNHLFELMAKRMTKTEGEKYLFPSWGTTGHVTEAQKAVAKVATESGVGFVMHDLRRTFATIAESLDISAFAVKRLLNHAVDKNDVTSGYLVLDAERLRKPMQQIEDFILSNVGIQTRGKKR